MEQPSGAYAPRRKSAFFFSLLAVTLAATHTQTARAGGNVFGVDVDNFGQINENYYRGAQPEFEGFKQLRKLGIKTVIDLQEDGPEREPDWVRAAGMRYFNIPLSSVRPATAPQTAYFLKLVNDPDNWPMYVHCAGGRHRTGEMTAIYRITHDSWTADRAYQEMKQYKYYSFPSHGSLKDYVYEYYGNYRDTLAPSQGAPAPPPNISDGSDSTASSRISVVSK
jgi:protein tyrosine phosphatase (PTP) superfamily phosphohydrolase (DUF442 family)